MDNKINLSQLAESLAQKGGMSKTAAEQFVRNFFDLISENVIKEGLVKVKGLGTFKIVQLEDRESVNVNTGQRFTIEGHQKISFTPDAELKERINLPFAAFDTVEITPEQADELIRMDGEGMEESKEEQLKDEQPKEDNKNKVDNKVEIPAAENEAQHHPSPEVREVTQKKGVRFLLKSLLGLLYLILGLGVAVYLFWPVIGNKVLGIMERNITDKEKTEVVATDSTGNVNAPVKEVAPAVKPEVKPAEKPEQITEPAEKPAEKPVEKPAEKPSVQPAAPADRPATQRESVTQPVKLTLTAADQAKELPEFTEADTVNYVMDGDMTVHVLKSGETITVLALKYYGSKKLWPYIVKYNNITDAGKLQPGARIRIPVLRNR